MSPQRMPKPVMMWGIQGLSHPRSAPWIIPLSVKPTRTEAIAMMADNDGEWTWPKMYRRGYRAVRVRVEIVNQPRKLKRSECTLEKFALVVG